jgi:hypothetical protein
MTPSLPVLVPDPGRSARVVARCRERLEPRVADAAVPASVLIERVVFGGLALIYVSTIIGIAASIPRLG